MRDYEAFVNESARVLRRAGLLSVCEWTRSIDTDHRDGISNVAPRACAFLRAVENLLLTTHPAPPTISDVHHAINNQRDLRLSQCSLVSIPVGDWHSNPSWKILGNRYRDTLVTYAHSMRTFMEHFLTAGYVEQLIEGFISDLRSENRLISAYYVADVERV